MNFCFDIIPYEETIKSPQSHFSATQVQEKMQVMENLEEKSNKSRKKGKRIKKPRNFWSFKQESSYVEFLIKNIQILQKNLQQRRKFCINIMMSKAVQSRDKRQCHSHHQKMMQKYGSQEKIIIALSHKLNYSDDNSYYNIIQMLQNKSLKKMGQRAPFNVQLQHSSEDSQPKCKLLCMDFNVESIQIYFQRQFLDYSNLSSDIF